MVLPATLLPWETQREVIEKSLGPQFMGWVIFTVVAVGLGCVASQDLIRYKSFVCMVCMHDMSSFIEATILASRWYEGYSMCSWCSWTCVHMLPNGETVVVATPRTATNIWWVFWFWLPFLHCTSITQHAFGVTDCSDLPTVRVDSCVINFLWHYALWHQALSGYMTSNQSLEIKVFCRTLSHPHTNTNTSRTTWTPQQQPMRMRTRG